ncbi:MAG: hypothetical protein ACTMH5_18525, partial [Brachybacterium sp.]
MSTTTDAPVGRGPDAPRTPSTDGPRARPAQGGDYSKAEAWRRRLPLMPAFLFVVVCTQIPFLLTIWYSLRSRNLLRPEGEKFVGLRNYL